ncbi:MAG: 23S rRNA (guanosine(2251)-2'-O)-methyltransferase RlmB [Nitrospirae bacterium]|nr:23S rRNA (guanosine(2251)-2'-O)-methyltransferase RlmB [Nitrospirota bacterium]
MKHREHTRSEGGNTLLLEGTHAVEEALTSGRAGLLTEIYFRDGAHEARLEEVRKLAEQHRVPIRRLDAESFRRRFPDRHAQGITALLRGFPYADWLDAANVNGTILVLDHVQDPRNVGAILRSALAFNCAAVVMPKDRAAPITDVTIRASAGAAWHLPISRIANVAQSLSALRDGGRWIVGADARGKPLDEWQAPPGQALVLVVGEEGRGLHDLTRKRCDEILAIRHSPKLASLNVSVAAAIMLYELDRRTAGTG